MYARKKEKKAWVVIIRKEYPFDDLTAAVLQSQKSDARELQDAWRERLQRGEFIWYAVASQVEFELVVSRLPIPKRVLATLAFKNVGCAMSITLMSLAVLSVVGVSYYIELRNERTELLTRIEQHEKRDLFAWTLSMSELKMLEEKRAELGEREWERQYGELLRKRLEQDRKSDFLTVITRQKVDRAIQALADAKMQLGNGNLDQASDSVDRAIELLDSVVGDKKSSGNFSDRLRRDLITPEKPSAPQ